MNKLSLYQSIPLGIGSIMGSGILFLPSLTYYVSGSDVLLSWLLIVGLCFPGIFFLKEMISSLNLKNSSLSGMIELGLGKDIGNSVHLILLGTVIFGMPSAAIVAGQYIAESFQYDNIVVFSSVSLISLALIVNYLGLKTSSIVSLVISALIVSIAVYLIFHTSQPLTSYSVLKPTYNMNNIYSGAVLSFWAFAGFENLTFLYPKFKNPKRDLILTIVISVFICGAIYIGLVANYATIVPYAEIKQNTGLMQLASFAGGENLKLIISLFAVFAVAINLISWTGGIVELVMQASQIGVLPKSLNGNPKKSLLFLGLLFYCSLLIGLSSPSIFQNILTVVSTNFLVLYLLLTLSYAIFTTSKIKRILSVIVCLSLLVTLSSSSYMLIYPFALFLFTFFKVKRYEQI